MNISFQSVGQQVVTMQCSNALQVGNVCFPTNKNEVGVGGSGKAIFGVVESIRDGLAAVIYHGFVTVPYSGSAPGVGRKALANDGTGKVTLTNGAENYWVVANDEAAGTVTFLL